MTAKKQKMNSLDWTAWVLVVVGALNWGLIGVSNVNLVDSVFGAAGLTQVIYILVGLAGLYKIWKALGMK